MLGAFGEFERDLIKERAAEAPPGPRRPASGRCETKVLRI